MSANIVTKETIDLIVHLAIHGPEGFEGRWEPLAPLGYERELGQLLWRENHISVNARYGDQAPLIHDNFGHGEWRDYRPTKQSPIPAFPPDGDGWGRSAFGAIGNYDYQSCEHNGWLTSLASQITTTIVERVKAQLGNGRYCIDTGCRGPHQRRTPREVLGYCRHHQEHPEYRHAKLIERLAS